MQQEHDCKTVPFLLCLLWDCKQKRSEEFEFEFIKFIFWIYGALGHLGHWGTGALGHDLGHPWGTWGMVGHLGHGAPVPCNLVCGFRPPFLHVSPMCVLCVVLPSCMAYIRSPNSNPNAASNLLTLMCILPPNLPLTPFLPTFL